MYLSVRDEILLLAGFPTIRQGLEALKLKAVELNFGRDCCVPAIDGQQSSRRSLESEAQAQEFAAHARAKGVGISALLLANDFNSAQPEAELEWVKKGVQAAAWLGVEALRLDTIMRDAASLPVSTRIDKAAAFLLRLLEKTEALNVDLGMENHGEQGNDPDFLAGVIQKVNSPRVGLTLDTGNFYWAGQPLPRVYELIRQFAPHVKHTHLKNLSFPEEQRNLFRRPDEAYEKHAAALWQGDIDHAEVAAILKAAGYQRDLCVEDESICFLPEERRGEVLRQDVEFLRSII